MLRSCIVCLCLTACGSTVPIDAMDGGEGETGDVATSDSPAGETGSASTGIDDPSDPPPSTDWDAVAPMLEPRAGHTLTPLADGRILAFGGRADECGGAYVLAPEIYDPVADAWELLDAPAGTGRAGHVALPLGDAVVFLGGRNDDGFVPAVDRWDAGAWSSQAALTGVEDLRPERAAPLDATDLLIVAGDRTLRWRADVDEWSEVAGLEHDAIELVGTPDGVFAFARDTSDRSPGEVFRFDAAADTFEPVDTGHDAWAGVTYAPGWLLQYDAEGILGLDLDSLTPQRLHEDDNGSGLGFGRGVADDVGHVLFRRTDAELWEPHVFSVPDATMLQTQFFTTPEDAVWQGHAAAGLPGGGFLITGGTESEESSKLGWLPGCAALTGAHRWTPGL